MNPLTIWKAASLLQRIGVSIGLLLALFAAWKLFWWQHDRRVITEYEGQVQEAVATASASASAEAIDAAAESKNKTEQGNDKARKAAAGSSDPLKSGIDSLRAGQGSQHPGSR